MPARVLLFTMPRKKSSRAAIPTDPREVPLYSVGEASFIVGIPATTLHKWIYGRTYKARGELRESPRIIIAADEKAGLLSFANLAEAHVLDAIRGCKFSLKAIREAIDAIREMYPAEQKHPLITGEFYRQGKRLLIKKLNETLSVSRPTQGQRALESDILDPYLQRITRDDRDLPVRLFPTRDNPNAHVMVDMFIASGQPVVTNTGILVEFIHERNKTGESIKEIAEDYGLDERVVADAIRYVAAA